MRTLALLPVVAVCFLECGCLSHALQSGLTEQEAQEIVVALNDNGIDASAQKAPGEKKGSEQWTVAIHGGDQNLVRAWRVLKENGLPREKDKGMDEVFANAGMIPTATEEKARLLVGLAGEMSRTLKSVAGVVDARVHVVLPDNSPLLEKSEMAATTASVLLKYRGSEPPLKEEDIKRLVARGVEGLQPDNVAVVFKKVEMRRVPDRNLVPILGNQEVLVASLGLLALTSIGCIGLVARGRLQRSSIQKLQQQLRASSERGTLPEPAGRK